jgi:hypothetical protein
LRKAALISFAIAVVVGLAWLLKTAAGDERVVAWSLGVPSSGVAAKIVPNARVCQEPIDLPVEAGSVVFPVATDGRPGQPLDVTVRTPSGRILGRGKVPGGYVDGAPQEALLDRVAGPAGRSAVCIANEGDQPVFIYGSDNVTFSHTIVDGSLNPVDLDLRFLYKKPRPFIDLIPDAFDHAALFRPGWVGAWTFWALLAFLAIGAPVLLGFGLWRAAREDEDYGETDSIQSARFPQSDSASLVGTRSSSGSEAGSSTTAS